MSNLTAMIACTGMSTMLASHIKVRAKGRPTGSCLKQKADAKRVKNWIVTKVVMDEITAIPHQSFLDSSTIACPMVD